MPELIKQKIRTVPNWPKEGVMFRDITTLLQDVDGFTRTVDLFVERYKDVDIDVIVGIESRGFILGSVLAYKLGKSFVLIRKPGKLPSETEEVSYKTEYSTDTIEIHKDSIEEGDKVLLVDDLIATGGSILAACSLIKKLKGEVIECGVIVDLPDLKGSEKIKKEGYKVFTLVEFEGD